VTIAIADIRVGERLRRLDRGGLKFLIDSISEIGLQTPITVAKVDDHYLLVAGLHRLAACRQLGHREIAAVVIDMADVTRQIWEIDENLARAELTAAQEAMHLARRKELFDLKGDAIRTTHGGKQKMGFAKDVAERTGRNKSTITRAIARYEAIPGIASLVGTSLDRGVELDALAKKPEAEQSALIEAATAGKKVSARSPKAAAVKQLAEAKQVVAATPPEAEVASPEAKRPASSGGEGGGQDDGDHVDGDNQDHRLVGDEDEAPAGDNADGGGRDSRVDGEIDLIDCIAAAAEKLAAVASLDDGAVGRLDAVIRWLSEIRDRRAAAAGGEVEPDEAKDEYEINLQRSLALRATFKNATPTARKWWFNDMRDDLRLWLETEGFDLVQKRPKKEAADVAVDQVVKPTDPRRGGVA
jgi:ParB/RepB/Spo0J family partition protein